MSITHGRPDGYTTLTPFLVCSPAREAIAFYERVFGATVVGVMDGPGGPGGPDGPDGTAGTVMHAELQLPLGRLQLSDPMPAYGLAAPADPTRDAVSSSTCIYVTDVDAVFARAVAAGARVREAPADFVTGDRFASVQDPFGHRWAIMTRVEDVPDDVAAERLDEWARTQA